MTMEQQCPIRNAIQAKQKEMKFIWPNKTSVQTLEPISPHEWNPTKQAMKRWQKSSQHLSMKIIDTFGFCIVASSPIS